MIETFSCPPFVKVIAAGIRTDHDHEAWHASRVIVCMQSIYSYCVYKARIGVSGHMYVDLSL